MKIIALFLLIAQSFAAVAQTGPGGIGNTSSNGLWLRAGDVAQTDGSAVSVWPDFSGNGNDAAQATVASQPQYFSTSSLNGMPVVRLDGSNDELAVPDVDILDGTGGITFYVVLRPSNLNGSARGILGKRITFSTAIEYAYTWFFYTGNQVFCDIHTSDNRFNTTTTFASSTNYLLALDFDGSLPSAERTRMYSAGVKIRQASETSTTLPNSNQDFAIGALNVGYGTYLGGDIAELIHFNYSLDSVEHIIVTNYLAAKYGIALAGNDLYDEDNPGNGNFDFDLAGMGRISASVMHNDSRGSGIVRILNPAGLDNNEFMFWGHNGGLQSAIEAADVPTGVQARYERVWRVSEVNGSGTAADVGAVDIRWDLSNSTSVTASDLRLLIDTDNDGVFSDETPISGATSIGGNVYEFSGVTALANNLRFTLSTINTTQTPLPVTLVEFTAMLDDDKQVILEWKTASEINNDYFAVERSENAHDWEEVTRIKGAGNSTSLKIYNTADDHPMKGISYYRLKQVDFDGRYEYSPLRAVHLLPDARGELKIYPNPAVNQAVIEGFPTGNTRIKFYNSQGEDVTRRISYTHTGIGSIRIDVSGIPPGMYAVKGDALSAVFFKL